MRFVVYTVASLGLLACSSQTPVNQTQYLLGATVWSQTSGERRALHYQAYYLARLALDKDLKDKKKKLPRAVVVDIDETVLDNGAFQEKVVLSGKPYPANWQEWVKKAEAPAIQGAVDFLNYAHSKKVRVFYVTNRNQDYAQFTTENLKKAGFPDVSEETLISRVGNTSKEVHRKKIREKYSIVLLIGDNLNDFTDLFENKSASDRVKSVEDLKAKFGTEFIVLANPIYGDWEGAVLNYNYSVSDAEKEKLFRGSLKGF